jgi:hypothetical protein
MMSDRVTKLEAPATERIALGSVDYNVPELVPVFKMDLEREEDEGEKGAKSGKKRNTLGKDAVKVMKDWMFSSEHFHHPYPSELEKQQLAEAAGITQKQLSNWFTNARKRLWQPMMRERQGEGEVTAIRYKRMRNVLGEESSKATPKRRCLSTTQNTQYLDDENAGPLSAMKKLAQLNNVCDNADLHAASALLGLAMC